MLKQPDIIDCSAPTWSSVCRCHIWQKWGAPDDIILSWPFVMLGEAVFEREKMTPLDSEGTMYEASDILRFAH